MMHITYFMERLEINGVFESRRPPICNLLNFNELRPSVCGQTFYVQKSFTDWVGFAMY